MWVQFLFPKKRGEKGKKQTKNPKLYLANFYLFSRTELKSCDWGWGHYESVEGISHAPVFLSHFRLRAEC